jgi:diamine N-acetyltransferase
MLLQNENIHLRPVEPEDLELLYRWENNPEIWSISDTRQPYSRFVLRQYIADSDKSIYEIRQLRLMIVDNISNETVGTVDLYDYDIHNSRVALG